MVEILIAIFILIPAAAVVPTCAGDMSLFPETAPGNVAAIRITIVCTMGGLMAWWLWSNHQQMMSVTGHDRILEIAHAFGYLRIHCHF